MLDFCFRSDSLLCCDVCQVLYVLFIAALWGMVQMTQLFSVAKSTTLVNVAHGVVSRHAYRLSTWNLVRR